MNTKEITKEAQFSVFMINKPGVLQQVCQDLGQAKVNIVALTMMDSMEHGVLRIVVDDAPEARNVLKRLDVPTSETDVIVVPMPNHPGALADICTRLGEAKCRVSYAYVTSGVKGGRTIGIFKVANSPKAISTLSTPLKNRRKRQQLRRPRARNRR